MGLIKTVLMSIWNTPWYVRLYFVAVILPNFIVTCLLLYFVLLPWHTSDVHSTIMTYKEKRDYEIALLVTRQTAVNEKVLDGISQLNQHQSLMYQALLNRQAR